MMRGPLF